MVEICVRVSDMVMAQRLLCVFGSEDPRLFFPLAIIERTSNRRPRTASHENLGTGGQTTELPRGTVLPETNSPMWQQQVPSQSFVESSSAKTY